MNMPKLEDLDLYMNDHDCIAGYDKDGKVYGLSFQTGDIFLTKKQRINPYWGGCTVKYAKEIQQKIKSKIL